MNDKKGQFFVILNALLPILLGAAIYYFIFPEVVFVQKIDSLTGLHFHIQSLMVNNFLIRFLRNYLLDMMWGYALIFTLYFILGNNTAGLWRIFLIAVVFSAVMEILQLTPVAKGTFDICDMLVEFIAEAVAVFIIKKHFIWRSFK